jgi:TetR/AcrR family transcriptional repressor of nem operon
MATSGAATRTRILDAAQALVFEHGFAGTSLDSVLARTGLTKGAFFYHFRNKAELGQALIERFAAKEISELDRTLQRAEALSEDPLQQVLIFVGLLKEPLEALSAPAPGCLFAAYLYQPGEFAPEVTAVAATTLGEWRQRLSAKFVAIAARHPPARPVDPDALADHLTVTVEGAYILSKAFGDAGLPARQVALYRRFLEDLFVGTAPS